MSQVTESNNGVQHVQNLKEEEHKLTLEFEDKLKALVSFTPDLNIINVIL